MWQFLIPLLAGAGAVLYIQNKVEDKSLLDDKTMDQLSIIAAVASMFFMGFMTMKANLMSKIYTKTGKLNIPALILVLGLLIGVPLFVSYLFRSGLEKVKSSDEGKVAIWDIVSSGEALKYIPTVNDDSDKPKTTVNYTPIIAVIALIGIIILRRVV